jgi:hypothetical protein
MEVDCDEELRSENVISGVHSGNPEKQPLEQGVGGPGSTANASVRPGDGTAQAGLAANKTAVNPFMTMMGNREKGATASVAAPKGKFSFEPPNTEFTYKPSDVNNNETKTRSLIAKYQEWELKFIQTKRKTGKYDINCVECQKGVRSDGVAGDVNSAGFRERQFKCPCGKLNGRMEAIFRKKGYNEEADIIAKELDNVKKSVQNLRQVSKVIGIKQPARIIKKRRATDLEGEENVPEHNDILEMEPGSNGGSNSSTVEDPNNPLVAENQRLKAMITKQSEDIKHQALELKRLSTTIDRLTKAIGKHPATENNPSTTNTNETTHNQDKNPGENREETIPQTQFDQLLAYIQKIEQKLEACKPTVVSPRELQKDKTARGPELSDFPSLPKSYADVLKTRASKPKMPSYKREKQERILLSLAAPRPQPAKHTKFWIKVENQRLLNSCRSMKEKVYVIRKLFRKLGVNGLILTFSVIGNAIIEIYCKEDNEIYIQEKFVDFGIRPIDYDVNELPPFMLQKEAICKAADRISRLYNYCRSTDMKSTVLRGVSGKILAVVQDRIEAKELESRKRRNEIEAKKNQQKRVLYGDDAQVHYQSTWLDFKTRVELEGIRVKDNEITTETRDQIRLIWGDVDKTNQEETKKAKHEILNKFTEAFSTKEIEMEEIETTTDGDAQMRL